MTVITNKTSTSSCSRFLEGFTAEDKRFRTVQIWINNKNEIEIRKNEIEIRLSGWDIKGSVHVLPCSCDFAAKTALFAIELMPPEIYADALEEEFSELVEVANYIRDWVKGTET